MGFNKWVLDKETAVELYQTQGKEYLLNRFKKTDGLLLMDQFTRDLVDTIKKGEDIDDFFSGNYKNNSREYTNEEVREKFLNHIRNMVDYWYKENIDLSLPRKYFNFEMDREYEKEDDELKIRLKGLAFSILSTIDGCSMNVPSFQLVPNPHKNDEQFNRDKGGNYYPHSEPNENDIAGELHEYFYND